MVKILQIESVKTNYRPIKTSTLSKKFEKSLLETDLKPLGVTSLCLAEVIYNDTLRSTPFFA